MPLGVRLMQKMHAPPMSPIGPLKEQLLQVRQEIEAALRRLHMREVALEQAALLGFTQGLLDRRDRQARALAEERERESFTQAKCIEHELEGQLIARHFVRLRDRVARQGILHVQARLSIPHLPNDAMRKAELAVR